MASPAPANFRIDVDIHNLLMNTASSGPKPHEVTGAPFADPVFPQYLDLLQDPGPEVIPQKRDWTYEQVWRKVRGWLFPYIRSRVLPGEFHPITAYLFVEYKCNLDCWYCWALQQQSQGNDGRCRAPLHRLAARSRLPRAGADGRRTSAATAIRTQSRVLRGEERFLDLYRHQWPSVASRCC